MAASNNPLALALSGGGHRATLFVLGGLMAVVDRNLNEEVVQVSSVSGGSIANARLAMHGNFQKLRSSQLDEIVEEVTDRIVEKGVLRKRDIVAVVVPLALAAIALTMLLSVVAPLWCSVIVGVFIFFLAFLGTGRFVEWRIDRAFFRGQRLGCCEGPVEHVICSTDLVLGAPVYFSTACGGVIWRRITARGRIVDGQRWDASSLKLSDAVRASAAFPGIPPRRIRFDSRRSSPRARTPSYLPEAQHTFGGRVDEVTQERWRREATRLLSKIPVVAFLADGGMWNNLGTQVMREDEFYHGDRGQPPSRLLVLDASASLDETSSNGLHIPVWSVGVWLMRALQILNANSVGPRNDAIKNALLRRAEGLTYYSANDPLDVIADMSRVSTTELFMRRLARHRRDHAEASPEIKQWKDKVIGTLDDWFYDQVGGTATDQELVKEMEKLARNRPPPDFQRGGTVDYDAVEDLTTLSSWDELLGLLGDSNSDNSDVPTTLGTVSRAAARSLLAQGYANTWLASLAIRPASYEELSRIASIPDRLAKICSL